MSLIKNSSLFLPRETHSAYFSYMSNNGINNDNIVSMQEKDEHLDVCITNTKENHGATSINSMEALATQIYNTGLYQSYDDPEKITWYMHVPASTGLKESFSKVEMVYTNNQFKNAHFEYQKEIPPAIKTAQYNATQSDMVLIHNNSFYLPETPAKPNFFQRLINQLKFC
jgi:hypothetical protein